MQSRCQYVANVPSRVAEIALPPGLSPRACASSWIILPLCRFQGQETTVYEVDTISCYSFLGAAWKIWRNLQIMPSTKKNFSKPFFLPGSVLLGFRHQKMTVLPPPFCSGSTYYQVTCAMSVSFLGFHFRALSSTGRRTSLPRMTTSHSEAQKAQYVASITLFRSITFRMALMYSSSKGTSTIGVVGYSFRSPSFTLRSVLVKSTPRPMTGERP